MTNPKVYPPGFICCPDCDGEGVVYVQIGRDPDGAPREARRECDTCAGSGEVELICPECLAHVTVLVESDFSADHHWCLNCALEGTENYPEARQAELMALAAKEKAV